MTRIADISHWNKVTDWQKVKNSGVEGVILKCSQGISMVDATFEGYREGARSKGIYLGSYHFANGADPIAEADHYLKSVGEMKEGEILVLDYEINLNGAGNWCRKFLDRCFLKTGIRPLLYTNEARVKSIDWKEVVAGNYALWVARYYLNTGFIGVLRPSSGQWLFWLIWQYTSRGSVNGINGYVDLNYSRFSMEVLRKYGKKSAPVEIPLAYYWQRNPRYKGVKIGNTQTSFQLAGCYICSLAYVSREDPLVVMDKLVKEGGLIGDMIVPKAYDILGFQYLGKETDINKMPTYSPTIKEVWLGRSQHFVVRLLDSAGKRSIWDPWEGEYLPINYYQFRSYRLFKEKA